MAEETQVDTWHSTLPADLLVDHEGKQVPIAEHPVIKTTPDVATAAKRLVDAQKELGGRVRIPDEKAKPEEVKKFWQRLGVPEAPEKYEFDKPEDGNWNDDLLGKFSKFAYDNNIPAPLAKALVGFHNELMVEAENVFKSSVEQSKTALQGKWKNDYEKNVQVAEQGARYIFKDNEKGLELFDKLGLLFMPGVVEAFHLIGQAVAEDSTVHVTPVAGGEIDQAITALEKKLYELQPGPERDQVLKQRDELYNKKYGTRTVGVMP